MGTVYLAEQREPIRRRVALKVVKLGMDTAQVLARFDNERQALAMMDHPNIARIFDAGATTKGRPYFVMEYIEGAPITQYCDRKRMTTRERLALFLAVCRAVQHAHQKGVIHRDLKPSNVLVMEQDGAPVPKVIDFGIAKATDKWAVENTLLTQFGQIVGTPEYASPEQADTMTGDVDETSDVYSLGVLLYELLIGAVPFDTATLRNAGLAEMLRIIREEEAPSLSRKLTSMGAAATDIAARRQTDPASLRRLVDGDLNCDHDEGAGESARAALCFGVRSRSRYPEASWRTGPCWPRRRAGCTERASFSAGTGWPLSAQPRELVFLVLSGVTVWSLSRRDSATRPKLTDKDTIVLADFDNKTGDPVFDDTLRQGLSVELQQSPFLTLISDRNDPADAGSHGTAQRGAADFGNRSADLRANRKCGCPGRLDRTCWKPICIGPARKGLQHRKHSGSGAGGGRQERRCPELSQRDVAQIQNQSGRIAGYGGKALDAARRGHDTFTRSLESLQHRQ